MDGAGLPPLRLAVLDWAGGVTPPLGNNGSPADYVCNSGASANTNVLTQAQATCGGPGSVWFPDLVTHEAMWSFGVLVKF